MEPLKPISNNVITSSDDNNQRPNIITKVLVWYYYLINNIFILLQYINYKIQTLNLKLQRVSLLQNKDLHKITNIFSQYHSFAWLKKFFYSEQKIVSFFNIPYIISIFILDIFESLRKKTIFLYQTILLLSLPILLYRVNNQISFGQGKESLQHIIVGNKPILSLQNKLHQKIKSPKEWLYIHKIHEGIQGEIVDKHLLDSIDFRQSIKPPTFLKSIEYENNAINFKNEYLYIENRKSGPQKKKNNTDRYKAKSLREHYSDNQRILDMLKNIHLSESFSIFNTKTKFHDEWKVIDTSLKNLSDFRYESRLSTFDFSKAKGLETNSYKIKNPINLTSILDNCYILFIKPNRISSLNLYPYQSIDEQKDLENQKYLRYTELIKPKKIYQNTTKYTLSNNKISNNEQEKNQDLLEIEKKKDEKIQILQSLNFFNQVHIQEKIRKDISKINLSLIRFYKHTIDLLNVIPRWLREEEPISPQNLSKWNSRPLSNRSYTNKLFTLLDSERNKWRYKANERIKFYYHNFELESKKDNLNYVNYTFAQNKNFKKLFNFYWTYNKINFFNPLVNITDLSNLYKTSTEPFLINKNIKNQSCWHSLDYELNNQAALEIKQYQDQNVGYLPYQIRHRYHFQGPSIEKPHNVIENINILNLLKELHFAPIQNFIDPFVDTQTEQRSEGSGILYNNIIESDYNNYYSKTEKDYVKNWKPRIHALSSKIEARLTRREGKKDKNASEGFVHIIKYLSKLILKSGEYSVLSNKNCLPFFSNININQIYAKGIHAYAQEKQENKAYFQYKDLYLGKVGENKTYKIIENRDDSFGHLKNDVFPFLDFSKIYKNTQDPLFWFPLSLMDKNKIDGEFERPNKTNGIFLFRQEIYEPESKDIPQFNELTAVSSDSIKKREKLQNINQLNQSKILNKYNKWIFTPQWWWFHKKIIVDKIPAITQNVDDNSQTIVRPILHYILVSYQNSVQEFHKNISLHYTNKIFDRLQNWNKCLAEEMYRSTRAFIPIWNTLDFYKSLNAYEWAILGWFTTLCIVYYHWLPMFMGGTYINVWYKFEKMRSLSRPSWNTFLHILVHNSIDSPAQQVRLTMYASRGWIIWLKSKILAYLLSKTFLSNWLLHTTSIDLPRRKKNLVVNALITEKTLLENYHLWNSNRRVYTNYLSMSEYSKDEGLTYFQKWSHTSYRNPKLMQYKKSVSNQFQWLTDLFFYIDSSPYKLQGQSNTLSLMDTGKIPRNLPEPTLSTKRWLLIGAPETGKSYLVKNIAADAHVPLVHVSLKDIRHATPDLKYNKQKKYNKWIKQLADKGFLLENILELAKMLAPCILWISDLHEFHAKDNKYNQQGKIYDASLLLTILLKIMGNDLLPERQSNITLVGSSHSPALLDPKFVSRHRLDLIVNLRKPSFFQRQKILANLFTTNKLNVKGKRSFYELGSNTIGYSLRDISGLVNEILLITTTNSTKVVDTNIIRLAVYRQISKQSANNAILEREAIQYKIGRAIVQTTLVAPKPVFPLTLRHDLWKTRFYYLSNAFLEFAIDKSTVTELTILTHIVNCLSGSAARDAWILSKGQFDTGTLAITKELKHDLSIASSILQSLFLEFPMRDISSFNNDKKYTPLSDVRGKYNFAILEKATCSLNFFNRFTSYIYWSYRIQRLSLSWILLFDNIKKTRKTMILESSDDSQENNSYQILEEDLEKHLPYERRVTKRQQKRAKKIHSSFNEMVLESNLKNMGLPWISEYVMDYDALNLSILLLEARPIWNPPALTPAYSILFFDRDLVISRNMLTKVYITYGEKFQSEKLNPKRIKKQILWPDANIQNSHIHEKSTKEEESLQFHIEDFYSFRKMAKANAQLEQSQLQAPVYLYQSWTGPDNEESSRTDDLFNHRETLINENLRYRELLIYGTLLEIYHSLLNFFVTHQSLINNIEYSLMENGMLNREDIERAVNKTKFV